MEAEDRGAEGNEESRLRRCRLLVDLGRLEDAERAAMELLERWPDGHGACVQLARIAIRRGEQKEALTHLSHGRESFERCRPDPWGTYEEDVGQFEELEGLVATDGSADSEDESLGES